MELSIDSFFGIVLFAFLYGERDCAKILNKVDPVQSGGIKQLAQGSDMPSRREWSPHSNLDVVADTNKTSQNLEVHVYNGFRMIEQHRERYKCGGLAVCF